MAPTLLYMLCSNGSPNRPPPALPSPLPLWHNVRSEFQLPGECEPFWKDGQHCITTVTNCQLVVNVDLIVTPISCADYTFCKCSLNSLMSGDHLPNGICRLKASCNRAYTRICPSRAYDECILPEEPSLYSYDRTTHPAIKDLQHCRAFTAGDGAALPQPPGSLFPPTLTCRVPLLRLSSPQAQW